MAKDFQKDNPENWKLGIIYFNKNDSRFVLPKRELGFGWTLNFAHPVSYIFTGLILAFVAYKIYQ